MVISGVGCDLVSGVYRVPKWNDRVAMVTVALTSIDRFGPKIRNFRKEFPRWNLDYGCTVAHGVRQGM